VTATVSTLHKSGLSTRNLANSMKFLSYSPGPRLAPDGFSTVERLKLCAPHKRVQGPGLPNQGTR
jgi:hypothetical protein